ncbi:MAG TPA: ASCH domain-containing protein [Anaerolineales bacterium]
MNFKPELIEKILRGEKTQTRRLVGERDFCLPGLHLAEIKSVVIEDGYRDNRHRIKWQVGQTYAICPGRGKQAVGRIQITAIRRERLQEITSDDCWAEGVRLGGSMIISYRILFEDLWQSLYAGQPGKQWDDNPWVWALTFELAEAIEAVQR